MKQKKVLTAICAMMLIVCMLVSFAGCGKKVEVKAKVGVLLPENNSMYAEMLGGYEDSLDSRYVKGAIVYVEKNAEGDASKFAGLIREMVDEGVAAIVAFGDDAAKAAVSQNLAVPVFFVGVSDALALGVTTDLSAPDKNATGSELLVPADRLAEDSQKFKEFSSYGIIFDSADMIGTHAATLIEIALSGRGLAFDAKGVTSEEEAVAAANELSDSCDAIILANDDVGNAAAADIIAAADAKSVPVFGFNKEIVEKGAALAVGASVRESGALVGQMTYAVIEGAAIGTIPVISGASTTQTYVNMGKAVALGYTICDEFLNTAELINKVELEATEEPAEGETAEDVAEEAE